MDTLPEYGAKSSKNLEGVIRNQEVGTKSGPAYSSARLSTCSKARAAGRPVPRTPRADRGLPHLEDKSTGTKVGIGVATGADKVFIVDGDPQVLKPNVCCPWRWFAISRTGQLSGVARCSGDWGPGLADSDDPVVFFLDRQAISTS